MGLYSRMNPSVRASGVTACLAVAEWNYRRLPVAHRAERVNDDLVSIIVPARDEARTLPALLASLRALNYPALEVIVVDDESTDDTVQLARAAGCGVVGAGPLPAGWSGKCHACWIGASRARGKWLLFTDADTVHAPDTLRAALALAADPQTSLVSLLAEQQCITFWERLILPYAYALYFVSAIRLNELGGPSIANGQYMLFRREAYFACGGHMAVRGSIVEDVALAGIVRRRGGRVVLARGEQFLGVRMYGGLVPLWEGFSKNAVRFLAQSPATGMLTAVASVGVATAWLSLTRAPSKRLAMLWALAPVAGLAPWYRRFGVSPLYAFLYPLTSAVFGGIALDSIRRTLISGKTRWRGRRY